ncbi:MAG: ATP-grasp domain-containing protein [Candidatus Bathyarchaeota archaeon]|nr:ATP-grasp domain-containing protein [Candidatus Bathyarchaeota archaeon]MDH5786717.1 ATP-grasp domain-containing protein [Candidatus Bathyarchaeota archaeon]
MSGVKNLLVVGIDVVSIANSAKEAGYKIYAADYFGDMDLRRVCDGYVSIIEQKPGKSCGRIEVEFKPEAFIEMARFFLEQYEIDAILLSSGLDDYFDILSKLNNMVSILGNSPKIIRRVREKLGFFEQLDRLGIQHPKTAIVKDSVEAKAVSMDIGYPVVLKPARGFGGLGSRMVRSSREMEETFFEVSSAGEGVLIQEYIDGVHASVSFLAANGNLQVLSINEQLLGLLSVSQREAFGYCGNIVPLRLAGPIFEKCNDIAEKIALHFGLKGSNGIDLVISKNSVPYVMEVNPRFQGTLECVEEVMRINLVESHINSCVRGSLPTIKEKASIFSTRLILYANKRVTAPDLTVFQEVRDVPLPETIIEKGEPLCSVITKGNSRDSSLQKAKKLAKSIYDLIRPV